MDNIRRILAGYGATLVLVAAMPLATAQDAPPQETPEPGQAQRDATDAAGERGTVEAMREVTVERRDEAVAAARRAADELDRQMEQLQRQMDEGWDRMSQATRSRSQATMADLRQRRNALAEWFGGMRHGSAAAWVEVRGGFIKSYQELAEAMRKARNEYAREQTESAPAAPEPAAPESDPDVPTR